MQRERKITKNSQETVQKTLKLVLTYFVAVDDAKEILLERRGEFRRYLHLHSCCGGIVHRLWARAPKVSQSLLYLYNYSDHKDSCQHNIRLDQVSSLAVQYCL